MEISSNDDAAVGVQYSEVTFNAVGGVEYNMAVDGFGGGGEIVIQWNLTPSTTRLPELTGQPESTNTTAGADLQLETGSTSGRATVEWYFNGVLIASNITSLNLQNIGADQVGIYTAVVREGTRLITTRPAIIQYNLIDGAADSTVSAHDKFGDALARIFQSE